MKRKLSRRDFLRVGGAGVAGAALLGTTYGCGGRGEEAQSAARAGGEVTLTWWDAQTDEPDTTYEQNRLDRYMEANPNVTVERRAVPFDSYVQTLQQNAAAGELPDVVAINNPLHQGFAEAGIFLDVTERVERWGQADAFFEAPWNSTLWQGKNYGLPDGSTSLALFYNTDMLERAGVDPPTTWDELRTSAEALADGDRSGFALSCVNTTEGVFNFLPFLWQSGADVPNVDSEGGREALQLLVDAIDRGWMSRGVLNWTQEDVLNQFMNGQAAMIVNGNWQLPTLREDAPDLNWEVAPLPRGEERASVLGGYNLAITPDSVNADAAWDLLTWLQRPENAREYWIQGQRLPTRKDMVDDPPWSEDPALGVFMDQMEVTRPMAYGPNWGEIASAISEAQQAALTGQSTVDAALARAQEKINPLLPE